MKWHKYENQKRYNDMIKKGLTNRYEAHGGDSFIVQYTNNDFIHNLFEKVNNVSPANVLVIGTGTGADACILDNMGYNVTAIDIIDEAINQAKANAKSINCNAKFMQDDILKPKHKYKKYDIIFSSSCLQSIVTDKDRAAYYDFVIKHLKEKGKHIITSAGYSPNKNYTNDIRDNDTGIVYSPVPENVELADMKIIDGKPYAPSRRHYTMVQFHEELLRYGFEVEFDGSEGVDEWGSLVVICLINRWLFPRTLS
ncbi:class I SAM-dependent methyltransferase [Clostridium sp. 'deep sea']|uniref:class I SAM-dependent methyltransferase n=1 Tax=Clostridium sp. 'deep sea' TaxID=2779445 RepID=UPI0018965790|nr:class I SAM-dependent methyltransferase [Clostridium sp. 'deep sea']QOR36002.1 class I SAM-dependent methyltransferase [Clostridium sp. 'deep sea']